MNIIISSLKKDGQTHPLCPVKAIKMYLEKLKTLKVIVYSCISVQEETYKDLRCHLCYAVPLIKPALTAFLRLMTLGRCLHLWHGQEEWTLEK